MSTSLDRLLVETATRVAITRNEFGDTVYGSTTEVACLFRNASTVQLASGIEVQKIGSSKAEGILWFGADEPAEEGDIYYHPEQGYLRIESVVHARRRVVDNSKQFIKCGVSRFRQIS